jgi:ATP:ADP antiporter, AAA family
MLRPLRDALMIEAGIGDLSTTMSLTLAATIAVAPLIYIAGRAFPPARAAAISYAAFAAILVFAAHRHGAAPSAASAQLLAVIISAGSFILAASFWSSLNGCRSRSAADIRLIALGGGAGALAGPSLSLLLSSAGPLPMSIASAALLLIIPLLVPRANRLASPEFEVKPAEGRASLAIGLFILLTSAAGTFLYVQQLSIVSDHFDAAVDRTRFFAAAEAASAVLLLVSVVLRGRGPNALAVSAVIGASLVAVAALPALLTVFVTLMARRLVEQLAARPARELAYDLVLSARGRRPRVMIDALAGRTGDAAAANLVALGGFGPLIGGLAASAALGVVSLKLNRWLRKEADQ